MSFCRNCGAEIGEAKFCPECGTPVEDTSETIQITNGASARTNDDTMPEHNDMPRQESATEPEMVMKQAAIQSREVKKRPNLLWGIGLFVASIVAMFFNGWVGLIVSAAVVVLSIVILVKRGKLYGFAIAALVIACIGAIVSVNKIVLDANLKRLTQISEEAKDTVNTDDKHPEFIVGTYVGEDGSGLTLFPDGATRYYYYTSPEIYTDGTWEYAKEEILWHFKGGDALSNCDVAAEVEGEDASELYFQSDALAWKDEHYKKVSDKAENSTEADYQAWIREVYPKVLGTDSGKNGFEEVEYIGITFQMPREFTFSGTDKGTDYYANDRGTAILLFSSAESVDDLSSASSKDIEEICGKILDSMVENMPQGLEINGEDEYNVDGMSCKVRDYQYEEGGKTGSLRLGLILNEKANGVMIAGVLVDANEESKSYLDIFDTMMKTAKRNNGYASDSVSQQSSSSDPERVDGVDPDLKAYLDSYETFVDEYVDFMESYLNDPTNIISMLDEYTDIMNRLEEFEKQNDAYESSDMSAEDLEYFIDVTARCTKKMLSIYSSLSND